MNIERTLSLFVAAALALGACSQTTQDHADATANSAGNDIDATVDTAADDGNATSLRPIDDRTMVNMSVWTDAQSLSAFVFRTAHVEIMRRRREWFERMPEAYLVLWWVPEAHIPSVDEAVARLAHVRANGPTPHAFNFRSVFPPPDATQAGKPSPIDDTCPAS